MLIRDVAEYVIERIVSSVRHSIPWDQLRSVTLGQYQVAHRRISVTNFQVGVLKEKISNTITKVKF